MPNRLILSTIPALLIVPHSPGPGKPCMPVGVTHTLSLYTSLAHFRPLLISHPQGAEHRAFSSATEAIQWLREGGVVLAPDGTFITEAAAPAQELPEDKGTRAAAAVDASAPPALLASPTEVFVAEAALPLRQPPLHAGVSIPSPEEAAAGAAARAATRATMAFSIPSLARQVLALLSEKQARELQVAALRASAASVTSLNTAPVLMVGTSEAIPEEQLGLSLTPPPPRVGAVPADSRAALDMAPPQQVGNKNGSGGSPVNPPKDFIRPLDNRLSDAGDAKPGIPPDKGHMAWEAITTDGKRMRTQAAPGKIEDPGCTRCRALNLWPCTFALMQPPVPQSQLLS